MKRSFKSPFTYFAVLLAVLIGLFVSDHEQPASMPLAEQVHAGGNSLQSQASEAPHATWQPGSKGPLASSADFSTTKSLAISLSYPLHADGISTHPAAFTGGGRIDRSLASLPYREAKSRARSIAEFANNNHPPSATANFADCGAFTATVIINKIDARFPGLLVSRQREYVNNPDNGWARIAIGDSYNESQLRTGDIFISTEDPSNSDHTWIWLGDVGGYSDVIAQASYGLEGSRSAHLPALTINPLRDSPQDSRGRSYEVWRFTQ